jgi:cyclopropane fatty-acyl-phospholipid synthase-like methyltransferase
MKSINNIFILVIISVIIIQVAVTYLYTNTKKFSIRALIRNLSIGICIYFYTLTKNVYLLFIPLLLEIAIEVAKWNGFHIEKYIATEYSYSDYFHALSIETDNIYTNFTEGNCDKIFGFDTEDYSSDNVKKILDWSEKVYNDAYDKKHEYFVDINGNKHYEDIKIKTDDAKFKLICDICKVKPGMKVLEIGFGDGDFMNYLKKHYNIDTVGVSISEKQVELVKSKGFNAYHMDYWNITSDVIGKYDLVLQCGNIEYAICSGENENRYTELCKIVNSLLNEKGNYFITYIHHNENFGELSLYDRILLYFLWSGNDGYYSDGKDGFSKYAEKAGLFPIHQEDRTNDYFITSMLFMSYYRCRKGLCENIISLPGILHALFKTIAGPYYIHTYLCYQPSKYYDLVPWVYQFMPQYKNGKWVSPETLQYILFEKRT